MAPDIVAASCIIAAASAVRSTKLLHRRADPSSSRDAEGLPFALDSQETGLPEEPQSSLVPEHSLSDGDPESMMVEAQRRSRKPSPCRERE
ncbi:hypothetical protein ATEIFO6365_0009032700 [Aspergillus terreus]|uniref:Uncharacterized protein n=1 Tax=Aspergillus terreus TaxID=33178 RepID=A0A5M3Z9E6_ASPTE|nr:hypothetical protein ATETN484_0011032700 [Aspergillus terreus]GFF18964.1 hypothetical protein ATEIFO6365_0009032700 [Aspergillus terreus]